MNEELLPSKAVDSSEPIGYRVMAPGTASAYALEDVDTRGRSRFNGPFLPNEQFGARPQPEAVDWDRIEAQRRALPPRAKQSPEHASVILASKETRLEARAKKAPASSTSVNLLVGEDGLYRVSHEQLLQQGFDFSGVSSKSLALSRQGEPVPVFVSADRKFGPGAYIEFYGTAADTLYTRVMPYQLRVDSRRAAFIETESAAPAGDASTAWYRQSDEHENNRQYSFASPTADPWYDTRMLVFGSSADWAYEFELDRLQTDAPQPSISLRMWGVTDWPMAPDHHVIVEVNGQQVADRFFDGLAEQSFSIDLPAGVLVEGTNVLKLVLPADTGAAYDLINFDGFTVGYGRGFVSRDGGTLEFDSAGTAFDVSGFSSGEFAVYRVDGHGTVRLDAVQPWGSGGQFGVSFAGSGEQAKYVVATAEALKTPVLEAVRIETDITRGSADYLIISHPDFIPGLQPLVAARQADGLEVRVTDVFDVYTRFSHGLVDPRAIRDYIFYAADRLGIQYVLLVGGDTYDYHDYLGLGSISFIPSLYAATGSLVSFAPVDPLYTDLDGDKIPDLPIGRMPVRSLAELQAIIDKTLLYGTKTYGGTGVFAADHDDPFTRLSFVQQSENFIAGLPASWNIERAFMDQSGLDAAREVLLGELNLGVALTNFVGHSGPTVWTFSNLFNANDALKLTNSASPTVVIQWGCWNTYHVQPGFNTMGHQFLLNSGGGAAAVLGSATLTEAASAEELSNRLAPLVALPGMTLGDALTAAKQRVGENAPEMLDVLLGWSLLGDPAIVVEP